MYAVVGMMMMMMIYLWVPSQVEALRYMNDLQSIFRNLIRHSKCGVVCPHMIGLSPIDFRGLTLGNSVAPDGVRYFKWYILIARDYCKAS